MKRKLLVFHLQLLAAAALAGYVQRLPVDVSDSRRNFPLRVARGEVVDLSVEFLDGGEPLDVSGAEVALHTRTNGMDAALSWVTRGAATNGNAAAFVLDVDAVLPLPSGEWSVVATRGGRVLARAGGPAYVRGTAAGSAAAEPASVLAAYATTGYVDRAVASIDIPPADLTPATNYVDAALSDYARTNGLLRAEADPVFAAWRDDDTSSFAGSAARADRADEAGWAEEARSAAFAGSATTAVAAESATTAEVAGTANVALALDDPDSGTWVTYVQIRAEIAAATNGVPRPDLSAYATRADLAAATNAMARYALHAPAAGPGGSAALLDRAVNAVPQGCTNIALPVRVGGYARDFLARVVADGTEPGWAWTAPDGARFVGAADSLAPEAGTNLVAFTEVADGEILVSRRMLEALP